MRVHVAGVGMHPFGRFPGKQVYRIAAEAARAAVLDSGLAWADVQALYVGHVYASHGAGHKVIDLLGRTGIPVMNIENACSSGGAALQLAARAVEEGAFDAVMALGFDKLPRGFMETTYYDAWRRPAGQAVNPAMFALAGRRHMHEYGVTERQLALVSVKNHRHAVENPYAMYRKPLTVEEILDSPLVVDPLRLLMLCAPNEGAAATVLTSDDRGARARPVHLRGMGLVTARYDHPLGEHMPVCSTVSPQDPPSITALSARQAYEMAGVAPEDVDVAEVQDTDSVSELLSVEGLGLCGPGEAAALTERGETALGGRVPVNPSGGLLSKGEPVGASSLGQVAEIVWQLRGEAGARQVEGARVGVSQSLGAGGNASVLVFSA